MPTPAKQSLFIVLTGARSSGKSEQIIRLLTAKVDGEPIATPTLFLTAESSAEGTAAVTLNDPSAACVWPVAHCEEATEALMQCFPKAGPVTLGEAKRRWLKVMSKRVADENLRALAEDKDAQAISPPAPLAASPRDHLVLRSVVVDTMSTLYEGSKNKCVRDLMTEAEGKKKGSSKDRAGKKDAPWNDERITGAFAAQRCQYLIDGLNRVTQDARGLISLVTVHTRAASKVMSLGEGQDKVTVVTGEVPDLGASKTVDAGVSATGYSRTWDILAGKANAIWHCFFDAPDYSDTSLADVNAAPARVMYGVVTDKGKYPKRGEVMWVKRQGGEGPWAIFDELPRYWHPKVRCPEHIAKNVSPDPDLGKAIAFALKQA